MQDSLEKEPLSIIPDQQAWISDGLLYYEKGSKQTITRATIKQTTVLAFATAWNKLSQVQPLIYGIPQNIHVNWETKPYKGTKEKQEVPVAHEESMAS